MVPTHWLAEFGCQAARRASCKETAVKDMEEVKPLIHDGSSDDAGSVWLPKMWTKGSKFESEMVLVTKNADGITGLCYLCGGECKLGMG